MEQIAFIWGPYMVYWSTAILTMACAVGLLLFLFLYLWDEADTVGGFCAVPLSLGFGMVFSRLAYWYFRPGSFESLRQALTDYSRGGFLLAGAFAGIFLAALLLAALRRGRHLGAMLDAMSLAGAGAIALGRLACFTNSADRGGILPKGALLGSEVISAATGAAEYRLNTFVLQSAAAGVIFLILLVVYFARKREYHRRPGDIFWLFCLYYGGSQAVLDSTRTDSYFFRANGFVSVVQVLGLCAVVLALVCFTVRYLKARGSKLGTLALWVTGLLFLGGAGYMEYYVQRHGSEAMFAYTGMGICMALVLVLGTILWSAARSREIPRSMPTVYKTMVQGDFR